MSLFFIMAPFCSSKHGIAALRLLYNIGPIIEKKVTSQYDNNIIYAVCDAGGGAVT